MPLGVSRNRRHAPLHCADGELSHDVGDARRLRARHHIHSYSPSAEQPQWNRLSLRGVPSVVDV